ncbi:MAG: hypothetical protein HC772_18235 [Leptolyngbyaceae cyanobacterium CRU_2_3]|nr:hypothetical protein [Leptolyngbyaceae cyanobacterium CRU_2_3]
MAGSENWERINIRLKQLKQVDARLTQNSNFAKLNKAPLEASIQSLEQAVNAKDAQATMQSTNEMVAKVLDLAEQANPSSLVDTMRLGYYARKLEMAAIAQNSDEVSTSAKAIQQTWESKKSQLPEGTGSPEVEQVDHW